MRYSIDRSHNTKAKSSKTTETRVVKNNSTKFSSKRKSKNLDINTDLKNREFHYNRNTKFIPTINLRGQTKMRYSTPETAAKIKGYSVTKTSFRNGELLNPMDFYEQYNPDTYDFENSKRNTWYEVNVPKDFLNMELRFKKGGLIKKENKGKFTKYCNGEVTQECIDKAKKSGNKKLVKRAIFAENARKWKHQAGGTIMLELEDPVKNFIKYGPNYIDSSDRYPGYMSVRTLMNRGLTLDKTVELLNNEDVMTLLYNNFAKRLGYENGEELNKVYESTDGFSSLFEDFLNNISDEELRPYRSFRMDNPILPTILTPLEEENLIYLSKYPYLYKLMNHVGDVESRFLLALDLNFEPEGDPIILKTNGNMNLAKIYPNLLDSVYINSKRSNTDFWTNLALIGKESTFDGALNLKIDEYSPSSLTNDHAAIWVTPYDDEILEIYRHPEWSVDRMEEAAKYFFTHPKQNKTKHYSDNILQDAFIRYANDPKKYNPGLSNYVDMVNNIRKELQEELLLLKLYNKLQQKYK